LWRAEKDRRLADDRGHGVSSASIFDALSGTARLTPWCVSMWVTTRTRSALLRGHRPGGVDVRIPGFDRFRVSGAMGAWAAAPERPILAVTGDGGFGQYLAEMTTAVKYHMPIRHVLVDNSAWGRSPRSNEAGEFEVLADLAAQSDFAAYAELCGALRHQGDQCRPVARRPRPGLRP